VKYRPACYHIGKEIVMDDNAKALVFLFLLALIVFFIAIGPIASIWAINTLFGTEIVLSFKTWCAMAWIHMILATKLKANKD
jgi:hypothetical protein